MATRPITGTLRHGDGTPWAGGVVTATLVAPYGGYTASAEYPNDTVTATSGAGGAFTLTLWANAEGLSGSVWRIQEPGTGQRPYDIVVPEGDAGVPVPLATLRQAADAATWPSAALAHVPPGGATDQVLTKASAADYDLEWAAAGAGSGHTLADEGTALPAQPTLNFTGAGVTATNNAGASRTDVTISGGVTDHGALTGLADDDHGQYHTDARGDARYAQRTNNLSDLGSAATARTNLGLGNVATRAVGTTAGTAAAGDDSRFTDSRPPSSHASSHISTGGDPIPAAVADGASGLLTGEQATYLSHFGLSHGTDLTVDALEVTAGLAVGGGLTVAGALAAQTGVFTQIQQGVATITTTTTLSSTGGTLWNIDATSGDVTVTLPPGSTTGNVVWQFVRVDGTANVVTLAADAADTIEGAASVPLASQYAGVVLRAVGTSLWVRQRVAVDAGGTVTSVSLTLPADFSVSGAPITGAGTLAVSAVAQPANTVKAGPSSGADAAPTYRALVATDLPALPYVPGAQVTGGGVLATAGFTLTVPATGTVALREVSNLFSGRQDVRASGSGVAAGLYVPWVPGDTLAALKAGAATTGNTQIGVQGDTDSGTGVLGAGQSGIGVQATSVTSIPLVATILSTTATTTVAPGLYVRHRTTQTPAAGLGTAIYWIANSATVADRPQGAVVTAWLDPTDASRATYLALSTVLGGTLTERVRVGSNGMLGVRVTAQTGAAALHAPWVTGDAVGTAVIGATTTGNNQPALTAQSNSSQAVLAQSVTGAAVLAQTGGTLFAGQYTGASVATPTLFTLANRTTGTPAIGSGMLLQFLCKSDTTTDQLQGQIATLWGTVADGTRKAQMRLYVGDAAATREFLRGDTSGTAPIIGFLGAAGQARPTLAAAATDLATVITLANNLRTQLINFGLGA